MRKFVLAGVAAVVALVVVIAYRSAVPPAQPAGAQGPPPVTVAKPVVRELIEQDEFTGRFDAVEAVEIRARVNGFLESVHFRDGGLVQAEDLLIVIDRRPYQATVNRVQATIASVQSRIDFFRGDLTRTEQLTRTGTSPTRTLDERRQQLLQSQADLAGARAELDQARLDLAFTEIRAPIGGRIGRRLVTEGNLVMANQTLLATIVALDPIYFYFDIDERSYLAYVRMTPAGGSDAVRGMQHPVQLALADEREMTHRGRLDFIDNRVDAASGTVRLRAIFDNPDLMLAPGLFGRIRIGGSLPYRAVLIPDEAIGADQDRRFVYVVSPDGAVEQRAVRPGPRQYGYRVVREGLTGEETIVVAGLQRIRPGGRVTPHETVLAPERP